QSAALDQCTLGDALEFDRHQFLPNLNLAYVDKSSMAAGVEVRVPLLGERVVERACLSDPASLVTGHTGKVPLRQAAVGLVPNEILQRSKTGFGGPARGWVRDGAAGQIRERVEA